MTLLIKPISIELSQNGSLIFRDAAGHVIELPTGSESDVLTISGGVPAWAAMIGGYTEGARIYRQADQVIPTSTWTVVTHDTERWDTDGIADIAGAPTKLTIQTAGKYEVGGNVRWAANSTNDRFFTFRLNGSAAGAEQAMPASNTAQTSINMATVLDLAVDDYVEMWVWQNSGGNLNIEWTNSANTEFWVQRIG